jgi:hypothetical protein
MHSSSAMEHEDSLIYSPESVTGPYFEPDKTYKEEQLYLDL